MELTSSWRLRALSASHSLRSSQMPLHPWQWSRVKLKARPTRYLTIRKRHSGQSMGLPGSARVKLESSAACSGRLGCSSSHFQYCAPLIHLPSQLSQRKAGRPDSKSTGTSSEVLQTGRFISQVHTPSHEQVIRAGVKLMNLRTNSSE